MQRRSASLPLRDEFGFVLVGGPEHQHLDPVLGDVDIFGFDADQGADDVHGQGKAELIDKSQRALCAMRAEMRCAQAVMTVSS